MAQIIYMQMKRSSKIAVFVDRDGTICFDKHYMSDPDDIELVPGVAEGIQRLNQAGIQVIIVTNQSGVGRGYFSENELKTFNEHLVAALDRQGANITEIFYCPHSPDVGCNCRKPATGLLESAKEKYGFDLTKSFVIGNRIMDVEMAHGVGAKGIIVPEPGDQYNIDSEIEASDDKPDFRAEDFLEAARWILMQI